MKPNNALFTCININHRFTNAPTARNDVTMNAAIRPINRLSHNHVYRIEVNVINMTLIIQIITG